jgi:hypothetical protein
VVEARTSAMISLKAVLANAPSELPGANGCGAGSQLWLCDHAEAVTDNPIGRAHDATTPSRGCHTCRTCGG